MKPLWSPSPEVVARANLTRFRQQLEEGLLTRFPAYEDLHRWSCEHPELFWPAVWRFCNIVGDAAWTDVVRPGKEMLFTRWFEGAKLNYAENLLRRSDSEEAIIAYTEDGQRRAVTFSALRTQALSIAAFLRKHGIKEGDRVAGFLPNIPETVAAMLGTTLIGAIWSSTSPDFGARGAIERFSQIEPKILFTADGHTYGGKHFALDEKLRAIIEALPSLTHVVVFRMTGDTVSSPRVPLLDFSEVLAETPAPWPPPRFPFSTPFAILYSSGTTGKPKCITHGAGGTLLQHLKELVLHTDLKRGEKIFYFTTCGWMMWNWLVSSLAAQATIVLYDGNPFHPSGETLFTLAEKEGLSVFGTSAKFLAAAEKAGVSPKNLGSFSQLRAVLSTGSPLAPQSFDYVYGQWKKDLCLSSISGGTDIISCFALGNPVGPVYRGELQALGLGMDVAVFDEHGNEMKRGAGELVCRKPFPSMPVCFWNDPENARYRETYFSTFPNIWRHGDWCERSETGGLIIYGRSDATLNPGGVRIGSAEIYRTVEEFTEVLECVAVGQQWQGDERVILFVKLRPGASLSADLQHRIRTAIRTQNTPRHVPAHIIVVEDIPKTMNGKIVELAIKDLIHGRTLKNREVIANPGALDSFQNLPQLAE